MAGAISSILNFREDMTAGLRRIAGQTQTNSREIHLLNNRVENFKESATSSFKDIAKEAAGLAAGFIGIGAAFLTIDSSIDSIKEYSDSLSQLAASTGKTGKEFDGMKKSMVAVYGQNFGDSWTDVGDSLAIVTQITGQTGKALEDSTKNALVYRDVFKAELPDSIKVTDTMMKQFGISSTQAYSLLAQGSQKGLDKSGELLDSVNEYSNQFKGLGFSASEMFDLFGAGLASGAFNLDKVGDSVKEFGIRSKDASTGSLAAFKALGFNATNMTKTFAQGGSGAKKAFNDVVVALDKVKDPVKKNAIGVALFGTQFEDMGVGAITALANVGKSFETTKDTMGEINKVKYTGMSSAMEGIKRTLETNVLIPIADKILPKLSDFSNWVSSKTPEIKTAIDNAFTTGKKILDGFKDSIGWVKDNAAWLTPVIIGLTAAIVAQGAIGAITKMMKAYRIATETMTFAQYALNLAMNLSPFGLIALAIGGVIALGVLLWQNWDTVKGAAIGLWNGIKEAFAPLGAFFSDMWDGMKSGFNSFVNFIIKGINMWIKIELLPLNLLIKGANLIPGVKIPEIALKIPELPAFALGTDRFKGGLAQVNERGGEIQNLPNGTSIIPADKSKKMIDNLGGGNTPIQIIIRGNVYGEKDFVNKVGYALQKKLSLQMANM